MRMSYKEELKKAKDIGVFLEIIEKNFDRQNFCYLADNICDIALYFREKSNSKKIIQVTISHTEKIIFREFDVKDDISLKSDESWITFENYNNTLGKVWERKYELKKLFRIS